MSNNAKIGADRAEGTSHGSGNPSAKPFLVDESIDEQMHSLADMGFVDALTGEVGHLLGHFSVEHLRYYFRVVSETASGDGPRMRDVHDVAVFDRLFRGLVFRCIEYMESKVLLPTHRNASSLYNRLGNEYKGYLDGRDMMRKLGRK